MSLQHFCGHMAGAYTEQTLKAQNQSQLIDLFLNSHEKLRII